MTAVPEKIRTGLIELRTSFGSLYVTPSFWQRVYLVWIFRNFRSLPRQVLSRRQQHVIDNLCRASTLSRKRPEGTTIIGAVENVAIPEPQAAPAIGKVVEIKLATHASEVLPAAVPDGQARRRVLAATAIQIDHLLLRGRALRNSVAKPLARMDIRTAAERSRHRIRRTPTWALTATAAALLLAGVIYFRGARPGHSRDVSIAEAQESVRPGVSQPAALPINAITPKTASHVVLPIPIKPAGDLSRIVAANKPESSAQVQHAGLREPLSVADDPAIERLHVIEPPQSGFSYPITPDPNLTGTVDLKAVIGSDGTVKEVDVLGGDRALAAAAVRAVRRWRYPPQQMNDRAVEAETRIVISFVGDDAVSVRFPANP